MAKIKFEGIENVIREFERLYGHSDDLCKAALSAGCAVIGNAQKAAIEGIPTDSRKYVKGMRNGIRPEAKKALIDSYGIAPVKTKNFTYDRKTGFDGYNSIKTDRWPKGQPNAMVARSVETGTSFLKPYRFMDKAAKAAQAEAEAAMQEALDKKASEIVGG